ncbi:hypothetical protein [Sporosarcina sp. A2]|uniref:hypothetical protein n=1 Tax=Sporosarcina sp. A2 TaxID=3393449 RepID=UPI003D79890C
MSKDYRTDKWRKGIASMKAAIAADKAEVNESRTPSERDRLFDDEVATRLGNTKNN